MRIPAFLPENGTIGFVAPSFGCTIEPYHTAFLHACEILEVSGYQTVKGPNCFAGDGLGISSSPENCAGEFCEMYPAKDNDALIACGGGELMCEILAHVDFDALKKAPAKWFMGFSDCTNLTFLLPTLCDTASIYGPCAPSFGMEPWHPVLEDALALLSGRENRVEDYGAWEKEGLKSEEEPLLPYNITEETKIISYPACDSVKMSGRLLGGCLDCLSNLSGTRFDAVRAFNQTYKEDGVLWFLEACDLHPLSIRRALWQLDQTGWFENARGFLIGRPRFAMEETEMGLDHYRAVTDILGKYNVPILMDIDLGHLPPSMPMVTGAFGKASLENGRLSIVYPELAVQPV